MTRRRHAPVRIERWIAVCALALFLPAYGPAAAETVDSCQRELVCATSTDAKNPDGSSAVHVRLRLGSLPDHSSYFNVRAPGAEQFEVALDGEFDFLVPAGGATEYSVQRCIRGNAFDRSNCSEWVSFNHPIVETPPPDIGAFCQEYANTAVSQVAQSQQMKCGYGGDRWNPSWPAHFHWCLSHQGAQQPPTIEASWRIRGLEECSARIEASTQKGIVQKPGGAADTFKQVTPAAPPPPPGKQTAKVIKPVDVFNAKGGVGTKIGALQEGATVEVMGACDDYWCNVLGPAVPNGNGWVWDGPEWDCLEF